MIAVIGLALLTAIILLGFALYLSGGGAVAQAKKLEERGDRDGSITLLENAVAETPGDRAARLMLADLLERANRAEAALDHAMHLLDELIPVAPADPPPADARPADPREVVDLGHRCARLMGALGRPRDAFDALSRCRVAADRLETGPRTDYVRAFAASAETCGETAAAVAAFRELTVLSGLDADEHLRFGKLLARAQQWEESIAHLKAAREGKRNDPAITRLLAQAYNNAGMHHEAWELYRTLFAERPNADRVVIAKEYADTLDRVGNIAGAIDVIEQVIRYPEAAPELRADLVCLIGDMLEKSKKPEEARREWRRALAIVPNYAPACMRLGIRPKPTNHEELIRYAREIPDEEFRKLFEKILSDWGYTIERFIAIDRDSLEFSVKRPEETKMRRKLVRVKRWDGHVGKFPMEDLRIDMLEQKFDGGVFIVMSQFSAEALLVAKRAGNIELFAGPELVELIARIELPS